MWERIYCFPHCAVLWFLFLIFFRYAQQYGEPDLSEIDEAFYEDDSIGFDSERLHKLSHNGLIIDVVPQ